MPPKAAKSKTGGGGGLANISMLMCIILLASAAACICFGQIDHCCAHPLQPNAKSWATLGLVGVIYLLVVAYAHDYDPSRRGTQGIVPEYDPGQSSQPVPRNVTPSREESEEKKEEEPPRMETAAKVCWSIVFFLAVFNIWMLLPANYGGASSSKTYTISGKVNGATDGSTGINNAMNAGGSGTGTTGDETASSDDSSSSDSDMRRRLIEGCDNEDHPHWKLMDWKTCSATCGEGIRTRVASCPAGDVTCIRGQCNPDPLDIPDCGEAPPTSCPCKSTDGCQWKVQDFGECEGACDSGKQTGTVKCLDSSGEPAEDSFCIESIGDPPPATQSCIGPCDFNLGAWGSCNTECGNGEQERTVTCKTADCSSSQPPQDTQKCAGEACAWSEWGACKANCGEEGLKHRVCTNAPEGQTCAEMPDSSAKCTAPPCTTPAKESQATAAPGATAAPPGLCACVMAWPFGIAAGALDAVTAWGWAFVVLIILAKVAHPKETARVLHATAILSPNAAPLGLIIAGSIGFLMEHRPGEAKMNAALETGTYGGVVLVPIVMVLAGLRRFGIRNRRRVVDTLLVVIMSIGCLFLAHYKSGGKTVKEWGI